jgi:hypothetical protein
MSTINILDIGDSGTTLDGTLFQANANPTDPSTGTGVFEPFVRIEALGSSTNPGSLQNGYNTNITPPDTNFDTKGGSDWTRAITLGEIGVVEVGGVEYYQFLLDANEEGSATSIANQIKLTDVQIYLGSDPLFATPELGTSYDGTPFDSLDNSLLGTAPVWTLDSAVNGDVDVLLQASICGSSGQCGSGHGDLEMLIKTSEIVGSPTDNLVFYTEYDMAGSPSGGFEEWSTRSATAPIPEPTAALLFSAGGLIAALSVRRSRS